MRHSRIAFDAPSRSGIAATTLTSSFFTMVLAVVIHRSYARCALTEVGRVTHDGPLYGAAAFRDAGGAVSCPARESGRHVDWSVAAYGIWDSAGKVIVDYRWRKTN